MSCECYKIGGRFIAEDPDCPIHGRASIKRDDRILEILQAVWEKELDPYSALTKINDLYH